MSEAKSHPERKTRSGPSSGSFTVARVQVQELAALAGPEVFTAPATDLLSDELLVERVMAGETHHYEMLMRRTSARLYRIARGIDSSAAAAEEVVRDAFVFAYHNLPTYDRHLRFSDWLGRIAMHGALAHLARMPKRPRSQPLRRQQQELVRRLEDAVDDLPDDFRIAFTLCVLDQLHPADAAECLGVSTEVVERRTFRGRLRVRRQLGMRFDDAEGRAFGLQLTIADAVVASVLARLAAR